MIRRPPRSTLFPYHDALPISTTRTCAARPAPPWPPARAWSGRSRSSATTPRSTCSRSEEHTSELQSRQYLVCRLLLEKKKNYTELLLHDTHKILPLK